ncbi:hypothetical protein SteCoe_10765 [Stentor coeruleus]|uniref:Tubulin--tyrosine ligase-like protein 9 n=1 Tax=Stentor coeruleus TaxID=5963 RepID=A0A1R2CES6_9CILI|nr:hypothetical protein SteCoe_10765 [Stentor coeruleus]
MNNQDYLSRRKNPNASVPPLKVKNHAGKGPVTLPAVDLKPLTPEKKSADNYIQRVKSIYSPNTVERSTHKNYRLHSRVSIFRGKILGSEQKDDHTIKTYDRAESKLKKGMEINYDNQKFIVQANKFDHLTVRLVEKEWMSKAREEIIRLLPLLINNSNNVAIVPSQNPNYIYFLGKGNNSELVKRIFTSRPWWTQADEETFPNVNLAWTQILNTKFIQTIPLADINKKPSASADQTFDKSSLDNYNLGYGLISKSLSYQTYGNKKVFASASIRMHNRLEFNFNLADKKYLYINMKRYYSAIGENVFDYLPLTFHIESIDDESGFSDFTKVFEVFKTKKMMNLWIVKPGENCNRGNGIFLCNNIEQIRNELKSNPFPKTGDHTFVIQKYIEKPFLINRRKFDIRLYCLVTSINGIIQAYYYQDGYIRTSCKEYNPKILDNKFIHLTNDAVQKKSEDYGKYEYANKLSYSEFQRYLDGHRPKIYMNFFNDIVPKMKKIVKDTISAVFKKLDFRKRAHSFEVFGYDFLLDEHLKPWLIEVNTNPCLELSSGLLASIIPNMLENAFRIAVDPLFPQPVGARRTMSAYYFNESHLENKFELIFHELYDGVNLMELLEQRRTLQDFYM